MLKIMENKNGEADYHFIEIMACPGCIGGGGPYRRWSSKIKAREDYTLRIKAIYGEEKELISEIP